MTRAMTIEELIRILQTYPQDTRVVVDGYEEGFDDLEPHLICTREIRLDAGKARYEGRHLAVEDTRDEDNGVVTALVLHRISH